MSGINIRRLAEALNVSVSTISKALNDSHEISKETKQKVLDMAHALHYRPNPYASSLRRKKSNTIAIVIPEVADSYFSIAINGIESAAREKNFHVIIYLTHEDPEREASILNDLSSGRVDGVLISMSSGTANYEAIKLLHDQNIPVVFFDRVCEAIPTAMVSTNDYESSFEATRHLIERGCHSVVFLSISNELSIFNARLQGYRDAMNQLSDAAAREVYCLHEHDACSKTLHQLLSAHDRPDGIIASVEKLATPIYETCFDLKLKIPEDVKIVCFSNQNTANVMNPPLTTVTQPAFEMGKQAAELILKSLSKRNFKLEDYHTVIPSELVQRKSS